MVNLSIPEDANPEDVEPVPICEEEQSRINLEVAQFFRMLDNLHNLVHFTTVGMALERLVNGVQTLILFHNHDTDTFHATATWEDQAKQVSVNRKGLLDAIMGVYGIGPRKKCRRCGVVKEHGEFSHLATSKDKRNCYCRTCERKRVKLWQETKTPKVMNAVQFKRCSKCRVKKPFHQFGTNNQKKDGKNVYCKKCRRRRRVTLL